MRLPLFLVFCLYFPTVSGAPASRDAIDPVENLLREKLNFSVDPCDDFYGYVCGNWLATHEMPTDPMSWRKDDTLKENKEKLGKSLEDVKKVPNSAAERKMKTFYWKCLDTNAVAKNGNKEMVSALKNLRKFFTLEDSKTSNANSFDFTELMINVFNGGTFPFFNIEVFPSFEADGTVIFISPSSVKFEGKSIANILLGNSTEKMDAYRRYLRDKATVIAEVYGSSADHLDAVVEDVLAFTIELASTTLGPQKMTGDGAESRRLSEMQAMFPRMDWIRYFKAISHTEVHAFFDSDPEIVGNKFDILSKVFQFVMSAKVSRIANFVILQFMEEFHYTYDKKMSAISEEFGKHVGNSSERMEVCRDLVISNFDHASSALFVNEHLTKEVESEVLEMTRNIKDAMRVLIGGEKWMDAQTRKFAEQKAKVMEYYVGTIDWVANAEQLDDYYKDLDIAREESLQKMLWVISKWKHDKKFILLVQKDKRIIAAQELLAKQMPAVIVNAVYLTFINMFVLLAGFLNEPRFYPNFPKAINYGSLGMVIGHEMMHGFDPNGSKFGHKGKLRNWWRNETRALLDRRIQCVIDQYNQEPVRNTTLKLNGDLTKGENVADFGGLKVSYQAYQAYLAKNGPEPRLKSFPEITNEQLFFIGFGQNLCTKQSEEGLAAQIKMDTHSPAEFRAQITARNSLEFAKAFNCPKGSKMNPIREDICEVW